MAGSVVRMQQPRMVIGANASSWPSRSIQPSQTPSVRKWHHWKGLCNSCVISPVSSFKTYDDLCRFTAGPTLQPEASCILRRNSCSVLKGRHQTRTRPAPNSWGVSPQNAATPVPVVTTTGLLHDRSIREWPVRPAPDGQPCRPGLFYTSG